MRTHTHVHRKREEMKERRQKATDNEGEKMKERDV